jgi:predicted secreted protein with PEFG-CTERM motif
MDYKAYAIITILLASFISAAPIGISYATTSNVTVGAGSNVTVGGGSNVTVGAATNATGGAATNATGGAATNATGGEWKSFELTIGNQTQPIQYMITGGSIENMTLNPQNLTLGVDIASTADGSLDIRLPRNIIDAKTAQGNETSFAAFIDNSEFTQPDENETSADMRTLSISFPSGSASIDIIGTTAIPEFSTIAVIILAVAILGIIITTARYGKFNFAPRL